MHIETVRGAEKRHAIPLSSKDRLMPQQPTILRDEEEREGAFLIKRFFIGSTGTERGAADWIVNDIRIDGKSQFLRPGDLSGELFATSMIETPEDRVRFTPGRKIEIIVTYVGADPSGVKFYGAAVVDPTE